MIEFLLWDVRQFPQNGRQRPFFARFVAEFALLFFVVILIYHVAIAAGFAGVYIPKVVA